MTDQNGTAAPAAPIVPAPAGKVAPAPAAGGKVAPKGAGKVAPKGAAVARILGTSLEGAASGSVAYHHIRGVAQSGREGTRLFPVLTEGGDFGYSLRRGGDFVALATAGAASGPLPAWKAGDLFMARYTPDGVRQVVRMLASLQGVTNNRDQATAAATVAGHIPPAVAVPLGLPRVTQVAGSRRPTGRAQTV